MTVGGILGTLLDLWQVFSSGMSSVFGFLNTPFDELLTLDIPFVDEILNFILDTLGFGDYTILGLMFGVGLSFMIVITIGKWLVAIIK